MGNIAEKFRGWLGRRRRKRAEFWERKRASGRSTFVSTFAALWFGLMFPTRILLDYWFDGYVQNGTLVLSGGFLLVSGLVMGYLAWSTAERKYNERIALKSRERLEKKINSFYE
jgi:hypothetical protein